METKKEILKRIKKEIEGKLGELCEILSPKEEANEERNPRPAYVTDFHQAMGLVLGFPPEKCRIWSNLDRWTYLYLYKDKEGRVVGNYEGLTPTFITVDEINSPWVVEEHE